MRNILMIHFNASAASLRTLCVYIQCYSIVLSYLNFYIIIGIPTHRINYLFINIQM